MNILRALLLICIAGAGYSYWKHHQETPGQVEAEAIVSEAGFAAMPPADGLRPRVVYVFAAQNCPREGAQRADRLAAALSRNGIPVQRTEHVHFSFASPPDAATMARLNRIMNGPLPIVLIDGRAKSNPSLEEVTAEFNGGRG
jgi:hypothetical protein